jgi:oligopeptide/dipeptide ABC transporter ATP-binding protein
MRVRSIVSEPLTARSHLTKQEVRAEVASLLEEVGLNPDHADHYPHEFSGGQGQRIAVARALSLRPKVIVLDEPVSALDVSIRAQIMNLLKEIQQEHNLSYLLIAHQLATVRYMSHRVGVMYLGKIVEEADSRELFTNPLHPYTKALISASLSARPDTQREEIVLSGEVPSSVDPPSGCSFHPRCPVAFEPCPNDVPALTEVAPGHMVSCHLYAGEQTPTRAETATWSGSA